MSVVITIVLLGLLASVSPSTIIVFILLLDTARARVNAAAFLIGWSVSLLIVFTASYAVGGADILQHGSGDKAVKVVEILLGAALAVAAARQWRHRDRPRTGSGVTKKFTARLKQLHPWEAAAVGVIEQPWTITAAAAVLLVRHHAALLIVVTAFLAFALLSNGHYRPDLLVLRPASRAGQSAPVRPEGSPGEGRPGGLRDRVPRGRRLPHRQRRYRHRRQLRHWVASAGQFGRPQSAVGQQDPGSLRGLPGGCRWRRGPSPGRCGRWRLRNITQPARPGHRRYAAAPGHGWSGNTRSPQPKLYR